MFELVTGIVAMGFEPQWIAPEQSFVLPPAVDWCASHVACAPVTPNAAATTTAANSSERILPMASSSLVARKCLGNFRRSRGVLLPEKVSSAGMEPVNTFREWNEGDEREPATKAISCGQNGRKAGGHPAVRVQQSKGAQLV